MTPVSRSQYTQRGCVAITGTLSDRLVMRDGLIDAAATSAKLGPSRYRGGRVNGDAHVAAERGAPTLAESQRRKEAALARLRELELEEASGRLVPISEVDSVWLQAIAVARQQILSMANSAADEVAMKPVEECAAILTRRCRNLLNELASTKFAVDDGKHNGADGEEAA